MHTTNILTKQEHLNNIVKTPQTVALYTSSTRMVRCHGDCAALRVSQVTRSDFRSLPPRRHPHGALGVARWEDYYNANTTNNLVCTVKNIPSFGFS